MARTPLIALLAVVMLFAAAPVAGQVGTYLRQYTSAPVKGPNPVITITNALSTWATGNVRIYKPILSVCMEYVVTINVGATFLMVTITTPDVCNRPDCNTGSPPNYNFPPCKAPVWVDSAIVNPFALEWVDKSTTAVYTLPTRQNVPTNIALEPQSITIAQALDRTLLTDLMELRITILPRETNQIVQPLNAWFSGATSIVDINFWSEFYMPFTRTESQRSLGIQWYTKVQQYPGSTYPVYTFYRRKQPTPPFVHKVRYGSGCPYTCCCCVINNCGWFNRIFSYATTQTNWVSTFDTCTTGTCMNWYQNTDWGTSFLVWEYYEDYRQHRNNVTVTFASLLTDVRDPNNGYVKSVSTTGPFPMRFRFTWRNLTESTYLRTDAQVAADAAMYIGLYIVPPFQIQDLWVTVHNELGNRLFTEVERRVPFRKDIGDTAGQLGWPYALSTMYHPSVRMSVIARYNRQTRLGTSEEEKRVALLRGFVEDNDGNVAQITAPIPKTILSENGLMGAVAANAITAGTKFATVSYQSCLTNNMTQAYYPWVMQRKLNRTAGWVGYFDNSTKPNHKTHIIMTLMLVTDVVSQQDYSTAFWTITDAFYPAAPSMIPHFWDPIQVERLFGFTEIPDFISYQLGNWSYEHSLISSQWPWFQKDVSVTKWRNLRAHVLRSTFAQGGELFLPPFIHLMRHSSTVPPNVDLWAEWSTATIDLRATSNIAQDGELYPNFYPGTFYKHEYLLRYGAVPPTSKDACTVPGYDGYLDLTSGTRFVLVSYWSSLYGETYRDALVRLISALNVKQASLPIVVDGLGSTPDQVNMAAAVLSSERTVIAWQLADATVELSLLPP
jgi:hypothetical protein